jgi:hypothetical protein
LKRFFAILLAAVSVWPVAHGQSATAPVNVPYRFTQAGRPVQSGELWLFYYGWGYVETYSLGQIRGGSVRVQLSDVIVRDHIKPPDNWEMFAVIVEVPNIGWYRTSDLGDFVADTVSALDRLGTVQVRAGIHVVDLPAPVKQKIRALNQDGTPRAGLTLRLEMYVTEANHYGVHHGLGEVREVTTDRNGEAELVAPIYPLYVENEFYEETQQPSGRALERKRGERLEAGQEHTLQHVWDRAPDRTFRLHIRNADGTAGSGALYAREGYGCDAGSILRGTTDARGDLTASFALEHATELLLGRDDRELQDQDSLTQGERNQLSRFGEVTIVWPRSEK